MLVVARRHPGGPEHRPPTRFVCLRRNSTAVTDATAVAAQLAAGTLDSAVGTVTEWPAELMVAGQWRPLGITSAHLAAVCGRLASGDLFPVRPLGELAHVGPAGQRIRDAFTKASVPDSKGRRALWHNNTEATRSLQAATDVYIHAKPDKTHLADKYWGQRSRLLLCDKPRLNTARVVAVRTVDPAVGSRWVPVSIRPSAADGEAARRWEKAISVWLNSTLGIASVIATAAPTILSRPKLSLDAMRRLPVPDLAPEYAASLAGVFDDHSRTELLPLSQADTCPVRQALDDAVCWTLGVPPETVASARRALTLEPSVTGQQSSDA